MPTRTLDLWSPIRGHHFLELELDESPLTDAIIAALQTPRSAVQARKSGAATCILLGDDFTAPAGFEEGSTNKFNLGDVAFSPAYSELVLAYEEVRFTGDDWTPSDCIPLGKILTEKSTLTKLGRSIWRDGSRQATVAHTD